MDDAGPEHLEVPAFGAVGHDGMIGAGAGGFEELQATTLAMRGLDDDAFEAFLVDHAGAGAGDEEAAGFDEGEADDVEVLVFSVTAVGVVAVVDEFGRIEEDDIPAVAVALFLTGPGEGVAVDPLDAGLVEVGVALGLFDGVFVEVDAGDLFGAAEDFGAEGEASGIAAEVEQSFAVDEGGEPPTVFALVTEEAGFMAGGEVEFVSDAVFADLDVAHGVAGEAADGDAFEAGDGLVDFDDDSFGAETGVQVGNPDGKPLEHAQAMNGNAQDIGELIHHQSAECVAVGVDDAKAVGLGGLGEAERFEAKVDGAVEVAEEVGFGEGFLSVMDDAKGDAGFGVPETGGELAAFLVVDGDEVTGFGLG